MFTLLSYPGLVADGKVDLAGQEQLHGCELSSNR